MNKQTIKSSLLGGLIYAGLMALDNYIGGERFNIWWFLIHLLVFGTISGLLIIYNQKQLDKEKRN